MKLLHVCRGMANSSGTTHIVLHLTEELSRLGCEVSLCYVEKGGEKPVLPDPKLVTSGGFALTLPHSNLGYSRAFEREIRGRMRDFDLVHIHAVWNFPTYCTMREAFRAGIPYVVSPQGSFEPWALRRNGLRKRVYSGCFEGRYFGRASLFQALSDAERDQIRNQGIDVPIAIIPNGVCLRDFQNGAGCPSLAESLGLPSGERTVLFLGRIHPKKGLETLADAFSRLQQKRSDITLVIAGHDAGSGYLQTVQGIFAEKRISQKTVFLGEVRGERKLETLLGADVFVLASFSEGIPVAVIEAMGAGLPVVITRGCHVPEVEESKAGFVVRNDPEEVSNALVQLFADDCERGRMGERARELVSRRFTWERIAREILEEYEKVLGSSGTGAKQARQSAASNV